MVLQADVELKARNSTVVNKGINSNNEQKSLGTFLFHTKIEMEIEKRVAG